MVRTESIVVLGMVGLVIYLVISMLTRDGEPPRVAVTGGRWRAAHYARGNSTYVVVRKVLPDRATVIDEHIVETLAENDPDYDARFLEAMARARQRAALYESEEG
jgi:pyridoxamine 5'-phosphate oxidase family protein